MSVELSDLLWAAAGVVGIKLVDIGISIAANVLTPKAVDAGTVLAGGWKQLRAFRYASSIHRLETYAANPSAVLLTFAQRIVFATFVAVSLTMIAWISVYHPVLTFFTADHWTNKLTSGKAAVIVTMAITLLYSAFIGGYFALADAALYRAKRRAGTLYRKALAKGIDVDPHLKRLRES